MNYNGMPTRTFIFMVFLLLIALMWANAYNKKYHEKVQAKMFSIYSIFK